MDWEMQNTGYPLKSIQLTIFMLHGTLLLPSKNLIFKSPYLIIPKNCNAIPLSWLSSAVSPYVSLIDKS